MFLITTSGANPSDGFYKAVTDAVEKKGCKVIGRYGCFGYDTFGPFKLVGGLKKGHPTEEEIEGAVAFLRRPLKTTEQSEMTDYEIIKTALEIARSAHEGQKDKAGEEYLDD